MLVRSLPAALVLAALLADAAGAHGLAFYLVVTAVPAAGAATLVAVGERAEGGGRGHDVPLAVATLALIVSAAAVRAPARLETGVPALAVTALAACLTLYAAQGLALLVAPLRRS